MAEKRAIEDARFVLPNACDILDNRMPDGMKLGFRPEKVRLNSIDAASGINIPVVVQTKEMLGSEIIYSLDTPFGTIMCKSEEDVQTDSKITVSVAYDSMYMFGADTMRLPFDDAARKAVKAAFGGYTV